MMGRKKWNKYQNIVGLSSRGKIRNEWRTCFYYLFIFRMYIAVCVCPSLCTCIRSRQEDKYNMKNLEFYPLIARFKNRYVMVQEFIWILRVSRFLRFVENNTKYYGHVHFTHSFDPRSFYSIFQSSFSFCLYPTFSESLRHSFRKIAWSIYRDFLFIRLELPTTVSRIQTPRFF